MSSEKGFYNLSVFLKGMLLSLITLFFCQCSEVDENLVRAKENGAPEDVLWLYKVGNYEDSLYHSKYDQAYNKYLQQGDYNNLGRVLSFYGYYLGAYSEADSTFINRSLSYIKADSEKDQNLESVYYLTGIQYGFLDETDKAKFYIKKAIDYSSDEENLLTYYSRLSMFYMYSHPDSSQYYIYQALENANENTQPILVTNLYMQKYHLNEVLKDDEQLKSSYKKVVDYAKKAEAPFYLAEINQAHSKYLLSQGDTTYREYVVKAAQIIDDNDLTDDYLEFFQAYLNFNIYLDAKQYEKALIAMATAKSKMFEVDAEQEYYYGLMKLKYDFYKNDEFDTAYFEKFIKQHSANSDYYIFSQLLNYGIDYSLKKKDFKKAYSYMSLQQGYQDSLWVANKRSTVIKYDRQFESLDKLQKIERQESVIYERTILIGALFGLMGFTILSALYFINLRRRKYAENRQILQEQYADELLDEIEKERSRIAGDLHDSVNHNLLNLKQQLQSNKSITIKNIESVIQQVRGISHNIYPVMFEEIGLEKSIKNLCYTTMESSELNIATQMNYTQTLTPHQSLQIYRIVEEALNNIIKHSGASHAVVKITNDDKVINVVVKDNGKGFPEEVVTGEKLTFGITNMQQRAKSIGGNITVASSNSGAQLNLIIDLEKLVA